jgi:hypothetical protein
MVLKRKNKVSKRLKKGMRGGDIYEEYSNWLNRNLQDTEFNTINTFNTTIETICTNLGIIVDDKNDENKSIIHRWATFMKIIKDTNEEEYKNNEFYKLTDYDISHLKTIAKEVEEQKIERELSIRKEEERRKKIKIRLGFFRSIGKKVSNTLSQLSETIIGRPRSALSTRHQAALPTRPQTALPTRPLSALGRKTSFALGPHRKSEENDVKEDDVEEHIILSSNVEEKNSNKTHDQIISEFDTVFLKILTQVNNKRKNGGSKPFKSIMMLVNNLPDIDTTLPALVDRELNTLEKRYIKILELVKKKCSGWRGTICSSAASLLGNQIYQIYINLKNNTNNTEISTEKLIDFIIDVLPIMMSKLEGVSEFTDEHAKLIIINNMLGLPDPIPASTKGGKKSSRATHKELQGRLMKIYRKPNDKKEYVKHKGFLISIKEYKEHMKQRAVITKKVILGKERCIYKVQGSNKEHVKYKGSLIPVADFKKLMKV